MKVHAMMLSPEFYDELENGENCGCGIGRRLRWCVGSVGRTERDNLFVSHRYAVLIHGLEP